MNSGSIFTSLPRTSNVTVAEPEASVRGRLEDGSDAMAPVNKIVEVFLINAHKLEFAHAYKETYRKCTNPGLHAREWRPYTKSRCPDWYLGT